MTLVSAQGRYKVIGVFCLVVACMGLITFLHVMRLAGVMGKTRTFDKVKSVLVRQCGVEEKRIRLSAALATDLKPDGLDRMELFQALEEQLEVAIPQEESDRMLTVQDVVNYLDRHGATARRNSR